MRTANVRILIHLRLWNYYARFESMKAKVAETLAPSVVVRKNFAARWLFVRVLMQFQNTTNRRECVIKWELSVMKSVPPRGSRWVFLKASSLKASGPTRYRGCVKRRKDTTGLSGGVSRSLLRKEPPNFLSMPRACLMEVHVLLRTTHLRNRQK